MSDDQHDKTVAAIERVLAWALLPALTGPPDKLSATDVMIVCDAAMAHLEAREQRQRAFDLGFRAAGGEIFPLANPKAVAEAPVSREQSEPVHIPHVTEIV